MIIYTVGLNKFLENIRSPAVAYNTEEEDDFTGVEIGVTNLVQHKMKISDSKPTSNP